MTKVKGWGGWKQGGGEEWCPADFNTRNQITAPKKEGSKDITREANRQKEKKKILIINRNSEKKWVKITDHVASSE